MATNPVWDQFVASATKIAKKTGFPVGVLLGQAALESARGQAAPGNNFFGIKGQGTAGGQNLATQEANAQGQMYGTTGGFAAYKSPEDSIMAYINLIKNNYPQAWAARDNPMAMLQAIHQGGYATDPDYVSKVASTPEFQAEHGSLTNMGTQDQQQAPPDPNASFPTPQNPAAQTTPYPLRDAMSQPQASPQMGSALPQPSQIPPAPRIQVMPQPYIPPTIPAATVGTTDPYLPQQQTTQAPPAPPAVTDQSTQAQDPNQQQAQKTYNFGPITISG